MLQHVPLRAGQTNNKSELTGTPLPSSVFNVFSVSKEPFWISVMFPARINSKEAPPSKEGDGEEEDEEEEKEEDR